MVLITAWVRLPDNFQPFVRFYNSVDHWGLSSALVDNVPLVEVVLHVPKKSGQWRKSPDSFYFMQVIYAFILQVVIFVGGFKKNRSYYYTELRFWSTQQQYHLKFFESILPLLNTLHRFRGTAGPSLITCLFVARCGTFIEDSPRKTLEPIDVTCPKVQPMPMKPPSDMRHLWCQWIPWRTQSLSWEGFVPRQASIDMFREVEGWFCDPNVMPVPKNGGTPNIMIVWNFTRDWTRRE